MKKMRMPFVMITLLFIVSCHVKSNETKSASDSTMAKDTIQANGINTGLSGLTFASKRDTTCGMPLSAGLEDTLVLSGKIYGFCSKQCKDEFVKQLAVQHKR